MTDTYPARFDHLDVEELSVDDIPAPPPDELMCHWGDPEMCQADNTLRAEFAGLALKAYAERTQPGEPAAAVMRDLLNDMRHLCDALDVNFEGLVAQDTNYRAELQGRF